MGSTQDCCVGMSKFLAFLSVVTFLLHAAGMANPYWLEKKMSIAAIFTELDLNIGVVWACTDQQVAPLGIDEYKCESLADIDEERVADWQWVAAGLGCASLVTTFVSLILSLCIVCKKGRNMGLRGAVICCYFMACALFVAVLVLFHENKEITVVTSPVEIKSDFGLNWGYYVGAVGACMIFIMSLFNMFAACGMKKSNAVV